MNEQYWIDYYDFIASVEMLTMQSPSYLINRYSELIDTLQNSDGKDLSELEFELSYDSWARVDIQKILCEEKLFENRLHKQFQDKITVLDKKIKKYIINFNEREWFENPSFKTDASH